MVYLLLAILSSACVSLVMRLSDTRIQHKLGLLSVNYLICTITAAGLIKGSLIPMVTDLWKAVIMGLIGGFLLLASFVLLQWNIRVNGVILSAVFMKLGILIPILLSVLLFHEMPAAMQVLGMILAILAILVINRDHSETKASNPSALILLLLLGGCGDALSKIYEQIGNAQIKEQYLFYQFAVALILCVGYMLSKGQKIGKVELGFGILLGVPNYFSSLFMLAALQHLPGVLVYPTYSIATILVITCAGTLFFHEKLGKQQIVGGLMILAALLLLNL